MPKRRDSTSDGRLLDRRESVEAVTRQLVGRDIIPEVAGLCSLGQQVPDEVSELQLTCLPLLRGD